MAKKLYTNKFKMTVVLESLKGSETIASLAQKYEIHPSQIQNWKAEGLKGLSDLFGGKKVAIKKEEAIISHEELERKIGQLTIENDFLKKKFQTLQDRIGSK
jgi:transposase